MPRQSIRKPEASAFGKILGRIRKGGAGVIVECSHELRKPEYASPITMYLATKFGQNPKLTRVLIRVAGQIDYRPLHHLLAASLAGPEGLDYQYELLDALGNTGKSEYAGITVPYLNEHHGFEIQSTAIHAIGLLGAPMAIPPLLRILKTQQGQIRELAMEALRKILSKQFHPNDLNEPLRAYPKQFQQMIQAAFNLSQSVHPEAVSNLSARSRKDSEPNPRTSGKP